MFWTIVVFFIAEYYLAFNWHKYFYESKNGTINKYYFSIDRQKHWKLKLYCKYAKKKNSNFINNNLKKKKT
jgi:hypothetical protein